MYCTPEDVAILIGIDAFSNNTNPTLQRVNELIATVTAEIDFYKNMYNFNATGQEALFKKKCAVGVAGTILLTYMNNNQTAGTQAQEFLKEYKDFLNNFKLKRKIASDFLE